MEQYRLDRLDEMIKDRRIIRNAWTGKDAEGRETACLLAAISPEVARTKSVAACPADVMPAWAADLVPAIDDNTSVETWWSMVERFGRVAHKWHVLDDDAWERVRYRTLRASLEIAAPHDKSGVVQLVIDLIDRALRGDTPSKEEWAAARAAARATAWAPAWATAWATAWDRIADAFLGAIENECTGATPDGRE